MQLNGAVLFANESETILQKRYILYMGKLLMVCKERIIGR